MCNKRMFYYSETKLSVEQCASELSAIPLPDSDLLDKCREINPLNTSNIYRRLLPVNYADGLYQVIT